LPIEATYTGARLAVARDLSIVLSRASEGTLSLGVEPARRRERAEPRVAR
jgi:hypothetical protein